MSDDLIPQGTLTGRQRTFVKAYTNPDSETFMQGAKSMRVVNKNMTPGSARSGACEMLHIPAVRSAIKEILESAGLGIEVRADSLKRILSHRDIGKSVSRVRHTEDETITETQAGPGFRDVTKAIDVLNRIDGTYDRNRAAADVATAEYQALVSRFFSTMTKAPKQTRGGGTNFPSGQ